jgi:hypothetical protein
MRWIGEQERRQSMLRQAGDLDDIVPTEARREADPSLPPMPNLLVIVDEFAELLAARPDFIDLFVVARTNWAQLGIHLLLSSQRLDEGQAARPGEPPALPDLPADLLGDRVEDRDRDARRVPAPVGPRDGLPQG